LLPDQGRRQRLYRLSAIVLKRRDLGEADRILTVLSRDRGKTQLLAKGVRRTASRKAGHIEPFTYVELLVAKGSNLDLVTQAETLTAHRRLREDLWRSSHGYYVAELADAFTQDHDPNSALFDLLLATLDRLDALPQLTLVARYYEVHLLALAGYQPQLFHCIECGRQLQPELNFFSLDAGGALCPEHGAAQPDSIPLQPAALKVLRFLQTREWDEVAPLQMSAPVAGQVERLLYRYLQHHLERQVSSLAFIERLRAQLPVTPEAAATDAHP
jgi:DNA repair protein RecO (recombination protein O)